MKILQYILIALLCFWAGGFMRGHVVYKELDGNPTMFVHTGTGSLYLNDRYITDLSYDPQKEMLFFKDSKERGWTFALNAPDDLQVSWIDSPIPPEEDDLEHGKNMFFIRFDEDNNVVIHNEEGWKFSPLNLETMQFLTQE